MIKPIKVNVDVIASTKSQKMTDKDNLNEVLVDSAKPLTEQEDDAIDAGAKKQPRPMELLWWQGSTTSK